MFATGVTAQEDHGGTAPLYYAAQQGNKKAVKLLLAHGADINVRVRQDQGKTALQVATERGHKEIADLLREHGAREQEERFLKYGQEERDCPADDCLASSTKTDNHYDEQNNNDDRSKRVHGPV